jgi:hypothetical protein
MVHHQEVKVGRTICTIYTTHGAVARRTRRIVAWLDANLAVGSAAVAGWHPLAETPYDGADQRRQSGRHSVCNLAVDRCHGGAILTLFDRDLFDLAGPSLREANLEGIDR